MESFSKHRIEQAKERLRNKLTFDYIRSIPKYKGLTKDQYEKLIENIESISLLLLETVIKSNTLNHG